jgi:hypothetical protein
MSNLLCRLFEKQDILIIVLNYIIPEDILNFDTAISKHELRSYFLQALQNPIFTMDICRYVSRMRFVQNLSLLDWIRLRKVHINRLIISTESCWHYFLNLFRTDQLRDMLLYHRIKYLDLMIYNDFALDGICETDMFECICLNCHDLVSIRIDGRMCITNEVFNNLITNCHSLRHIELDVCVKPAQKSNFIVINETMIGKFDELVYFCSCSCELSPTVIPSLRILFPRLQHLNLCSYEASQSTIEDILSQCDTITSLTTLFYQCQRIDGITTIQDKRILSATAYDDHRSDESSSLNDFDFDDNGSLSSDAEYDYDV